jgi:hypothetical protein
MMRATSLGEGAVEEKGGRRRRRCRDALAAQVGKRADPGRALRHDVVMAFGDRQDDPQIGMSERVSQRLRFGMAGQVRAAAVEELLNPTARGPRLRRAEL